MKYIIERTSLNHHNKKKPCEEAVRYSCEVWDARKCTEEQFNATSSRTANRWKSMGKNHKTIKNGIKRQLDNRMRWVVEINTLDELNKFAEKHREVILNCPSMWSEYTLPIIEIYDGYKE